MKNETLKIILQNLFVFILYWGVAHLNWIVFSSLGVLPMPIWTSAAVALVAAYYWGWRIILGIALGSFFANYISLKGSVELSFMICIMNSIAPVWGGIILKNKLSIPIKIKNFNDILFVFLVALVIVPALTALGGIGSKYILGLTKSNLFVIEFLRWLIAHSLGTLIFAIPTVIWINGRYKNE